MSWKPEVLVGRQWSQNQLVFATEEEAKRYAHDLFMRWTSTDDHRAVESSEPVNYRYEGHALIPVEGH
jgi:hypothetical protein